MEQKTRRKRKLGSYPFISVTLSISLALFVIGLFGLILIQANKLTDLIQENVEIQVFLSKDISESEITRIQRTVESKAYVLKRENNPSVSLITREEAARQFVEDTGEDFREFLGDNPLRDLLVVNIEPDYQSADSLRMIKSDIEKLRGVFEVAYVDTLVESINQNLARIGFVLFGFFLVLLIVVVILINNTIKLALFSQRFLIRSMQLVGATGAFIRRPFLLRSVLYGLVAGGVACAGLLLVLRYVNTRIEDLSQLQNWNHVWLILGMVCVLGSLVGYLSTWYAVRKYLKMSLDELY